MTKKTLDFAPLHGLGRRGVITFLGWKGAQGSQQTTGRAESAGAGSQGLTVLTGFLPDLKAITHNQSVGKS